MKNIKWLALAKAIGIYLCGIALVAALCLFVVAALYWIQQTIGYFNLLVYGAPVYCVLFVIVPICMLYKEQSKRTRKRDEESDSCDLRSAAWEADKKHQDS